MGSGNPSVDDYIEATTSVVDRLIGCSLDATDSVTDRFFGSTLVDQFSGLKLDGLYGSGDGFCCMFPTGRDIGMGMPYPPIRLQDTVFGFNSLKSPTAHGPRALPKPAPKAGAIAPKKVEDVVSEPGPDALPQALHDMPEQLSDQEGLNKVKVEPESRPAPPQTPRSPDFKPERELKDVDDLPWNTLNNGESQDTAASTARFDDDLFDDAQGGLQQFQGLPHTSLAPQSIGPQNLGGGDVQSSDSQLQLACPYLKHDPATYGQRPSCRGPSFATIHRLKEHLYRTHKQKPNCRRCRSTFGTEEDLDDHLNLQEPCKHNADGPAVTGFSSAQERKLRSKKRARSQSEEAKWRDVYQTLFPDCKDIPSPYYPSCFKDASRDSATSRRDCQTRIENVMLRGDIPPELEDEILLKIEGVIESQLNGRKRREMMVVVKDSLDKALRHATRSTHTNHDNLPTESPRADHTSKARSSVDPGATSDSSNSSALSNLQTAQISIGTGKDSRSGDDLLDGSTQVPTDTQEVHTSTWLPLEYEGFDFGEDLGLASWSDNWLVNEEGACDWGNTTKCQAPVWRKILDRESGEHSSSTVVVQNDLAAANQNMVERDRRYLGSQ